MKNKKSMHTTSSSGKRYTCHKAVLLFVFLSVSITVFSQIGLHISNYQGDVIFSRYLNTEIVPVDTLRGSGLYIYSNGKLKKGIYLFLIGNKTIEFPLGDDQSFRLIADYNSNNIQSTVQLSGSPDNSVFQEFYNKYLVGKKMNIEEGGLLVQIEDPFIRACVQALTPVVPPPGLSGSAARNYILEHYLDRIDFTMPALVNSPWVKRKIDSFFNELAGRDSITVSRYVSLLMDRPMDTSVRSEMAASLVLPVQERKK